MSLAAAATPRNEASHWFTRSNPLARLGGSVALSFPNLFVLDAVTAGITVAAALALLPVMGLPWRVVGRTLAVLVLVAGSAALANALAGAPSPAVAGLAGLRVLALVLPGALVFATLDPVDLADALVHQLRVPVRFAYGVLAAVRLTPALAEEWLVLARAERARGLVGRGPVDLVRRWTRRSVALLVAAVRRASRVAVALDSRGFDTATRSTAGSSSWVPADTLLVTAGAALGVVAWWAGQLVG